MSKELSIMGGQASMPAHLRTRYEGRQTDVMDVSIVPPSLSITGKVWTVNLGSESIVMKTKDADGNPINVQTLPLVILNYAKVRGRSYYEHNYDPTNTAPPDCWSNDGIVPDASIAEPVSARCNGCTMSVKGSRVTDNNKATTACAQNRLLAVIPAKRLDGKIPPLRLKLAQTSDYDGQSKDLQAEGWFAFSNFLSFLKTREIPYLYGLVVDVTFDSGAAYPKLLFRANRWLDEAEAELVDGLRERPEIAAILGEQAEMPEGGRQALPPRQTATAPKETAPPGEQAEKPRRTRASQKADKPAETPKPSAAAAALNDDVGDVGEGDGAGQEEDGAGQEEDEDDKAIRLAQERKAAKAAAAKANGAEKQAETAKPVKPAKDNAPTTATEVSSDAAALLGEWD